MTYTEWPGILLAWFDQNRRELPWRETKPRDPYHVWVSEIMLQQTRTEAVKPYFTSWMERFPTIEDLAEADEADVLHQWQGLGYYSRARNLHKAALLMKEKYGSAMPQGKEEIRALPGIGDYTAGAIGSIAFGLPTPAVDGNVLRVAARLTNDPSPIDLPQTKRKVSAALGEIYPENASDFTQALMELGATLCGPNWKPKCESCPCAALCLGYQKGTAEALPVKAPKKPKRQEDRTVFIISCADAYALRKRPDQGLLAGLWEFPNVTGKLDLSQALSAVEQFGVRPQNLLRQTEKKHIFTHIQWNLRGYYLEAAEKTDCFQWFTADQLRAQAALPTAFRQFLEENDHV